VGPLRRQWNGSIAVPINNSEQRYKESNEKTSSIHVAWPKMTVRFILMILIENTAR
jgi:hypothetical protein